MSYRVPLVAEDIDGVVHAVDSDEDPVHYGRLACGIDFLWKASGYEAEHHRGIHHLLMQRAKLTAALTCFWCLTQRSFHEP